MQAADYFKQLPLFSDLAPSEIIDVLRIARVVQFEPGQKLCSRGEPGDCAYLLEQGSASVRIAEGSAPAVEVARVGPGEILGELSLVDGHPRSADVVALGVVRGYRIDRSEFDAMRRAMHPAAFKMLRRIAITVSDRLRDINDAIAAELATPAEKGAAAAAAAEGQPAAKRGARRSRTAVREPGPGTSAQGSRAAVRASREIGRVSHVAPPRSSGATPSQELGRVSLPSRAAQEPARDAPPAGSFWSSVLGRLRGVPWK